MCSEWLISVCKMIVGLTGQSDGDIFIPLVELIFQMRMLVIVGALDNCLLVLISHLPLPKNKHQIPALNPSPRTLPNFFFSRNYFYHSVNLPFLSRYIHLSIHPFCRPACSRAQSHSHSLELLLVVVGQKQGDKLDKTPAHCSTT